MQSEAPPSSSNNQRRLFSLLVIAFMVAVSLVVLFLLLLRSSARPRPTPVPTRPPVPTATAIPPTVAPLAPATALAPPTPPPTADPNVAAIVNGEVVDRQALQVVAGSDRAMAAVLGMPVPQETALDRLINDVLVLQAARSAGFEVPQSEADQILAAFLSRRQISQETLQQALAQEGVSWEAFRDYFTRLITVDRFTRQQAAAMDQSVGLYLASLQHQARISYGAAADIPLPAPAIMPGPTPVTSPTATSELTAQVSLPNTDTLAVVERLAATPFPVPTGDEKRGLAKGQLAPDFSLPILGAENGEMLSWGDLLGHPVLLSFWTTWCPYCRKQTPNLIAGYEKWRSTGVEFVGIDVKEAAGVVAAYVEQTQIPYPIVLDEDGAVAQRYNVQGFPTTLFLDAEGRVLYRQIGVMTREKIDQWISAYKDAN